MKRACVVGLAVLGVLAILLVALAAIGVATGPLDPGRASESRCEQGDALRTARLLDAAQETYGDDDCEALDQVERAESHAEEHFAVARTYASTRPGDPGNSKRAIDHFAAGLARDPYDVEAATALTLELDKELVSDEVQCETGANLVGDGLLTVGAVALANGLPAGIERCEKTLVVLATRKTVAATLLGEADGRDPAAARLKYAAALGEDADLAAARSGLEGSLNGASRLDEITGWLKGVPGSLEDAVKWLVPLLLGLAVVGLLIALLIWLTIRELAKHSRSVRQWCEYWGGHPGLSFLRRAAVPDIEIAEFSGKGEGDLAGEDFSILLKGELYESTARGPAFPLDRVPVEPPPAPAQEVSVPSLVGEIPTAKVLGDVLRLTLKLFRRRKVLLCGHLTPAADKGAGVLLSMKGGGGRDRSVTIWERVYDPCPGGEGAVRWLRLVPAAAAWAQLHLDWAQDPTKEMELATWEGEALLKSAEAWELKGEPERAEPLYAAALEKDPGLLPAANNLALIELRDGRHERAEERVTELRRTLAKGIPCGRSVAKMLEQWPTLEAASHYTLILSLAYAGEERLEEAIGQARGLVAITAAALTGQDAATEQATTGKPTKAELRDQLLHDLYDASEAPSVVILASLEVRAADRDGRDLAVARAVECASGKGVAERIGREQLAGDDLEGLGPWDLIHGYVEHQPNPPRRTYYNLACYYASLIGHARRKADKRELYEHALEKLKAGLVGGEIVPWAEMDPSLGPLRGFPWFEHGVESFARALRARTIEPHENAP